MGQAFGTAPRGHDGQGHLVEADPDVVGGDPDVGGHRDLGAAAERVPVQRGDHRSGEGRDAIADPPHPQGHGHRVLLGPDRTQLFQVPAGDERPVACARDDQGLGARGRVERLVQFVHRGRGDGVAGVRPVDGDDRQALVEFEIYVHGLSPRLSLRRRQ